MRELAQKTGISYSSIAAKERGDIRFSRADIEVIALAFGITYDELLSYAREKMGNRNIRENGIPVLNRTSAGAIVDYPPWGSDSGDGVAYVDWGTVTAPTAFALQVIGDSMEPSIFDGDLVVLVPESYHEGKGVPDGSVVAVYFSPEARRQGTTLARWHITDDGKIELSKDNPRHRSIVAEREEIASVARVIERRTRRV